MSYLDIISDHSRKNLYVVPESILDMYNLKMLYLEGNHIKYLPDNFFLRLTLLTWLDLRNNELKEIPPSIGCHSFLENLLIQNNEIEILPNEIGLTRNLKVIQVSGNPLKYPPPNIVEKGTDAICTFLAVHWRKRNTIITETDEEEELMVVEPQSKVQRIKPEPTEKLSVQEILRRARLSVNSVEAESSLIVTKMQNMSNSRTTGSQTSGMEAVPPESSELKNSKAFRVLRSVKPPKIVHKMKKSCSRLSLHTSCINKSQGYKKIQNEKNSGSEKQIKEIWMGKLRSLLDDQEKILQNERNLEALTKWRFQKKQEPPRKTTQGQVPQPPYDTDPEYNTMLSRKDLSKQIDKMIKNNKKASKLKDLQQLIDEAYDRLKIIRKSSSGIEGTPRTKTKHAARNIQAIIALHKKIHQIQITNDTA